MSFQAESNGLDVGKILENFRLAKEKGSPSLNWTLVHQFWLLTKPFWVRPGAWKGYIWLGLFTVSVVGSSYVMVKVAEFAGKQLEALSAKDQSAFYWAILIGVGMQVGVYFSQSLLRLPFNLLIIKWRQWLTKSFIDLYLVDKNYYRLNRDHTIDNPDERIADDIEEFLKIPSIFVVVLIQAVSNLILFTYVLWNIKYYFVLLCAGYFLFDSLLRLIFSKPMLTISYSFSKLKGDFRFSLVNVRTNAESIAFLQGEEVEERELEQRLDRLVDNRVKETWWETLLTTISSFLNSFSEILPMVMVAPFILSGELGLGVLPQVQTAWMMLSISFGFIGMQAFFLTFVGAKVARLQDLKDTCEGKIKPEEETGQKIRVTKSGHLAVKDFYLETPGGERTLISNLNLDMEKQGRIIVTGINGIGKSSLLRGLAGLWTRGSGELCLPASEEIMFLPQRPYMSLGSLREQVTYPLPPEQFSDEEIREVMNKVKLGYLEEQHGGWAGMEDWKTVLSPGEQQRLVFARALLRKPKLIFLDEATSGIDVVGERHLYEYLQEINCTYISVAHRISLYEFHDTILELTGNAEWKATPMEEFIKSAKDATAGKAENEK